MRVRPRRARRSAARRAMMMPKKTGDRACLLSQEFSEQIFIHDILKNSVEEKIVATRFEYIY